MEELKLYLNLTHRVGGGNLALFEQQQDLAHQCGLKCTMIVGYDGLQNPDVIQRVKDYGAEYKEETGMLLSITDTTKSFAEGNYTFWLFTLEEKKRIINESMHRFQAVFGYFPQLLTCYYLDAPTVNYIKQNYPEVEAVVATCFEEGTKMLRGSNYTYYLFSEGGPWNPWIPSRENSQCPARDKDDDAGVVAFPHLSRDMVASIEDRNDYFASHPMNMTRGWVYEGKNWSYMYNFLDMAVRQSIYNDGYAYCNVYVDPKWIAKSGGHDDEVRLDIYRDCLGYLAKLKAKGYLQDMGMLEFARWYRQNRGYNKPDISLWQDIIFGSEKQAFWYIDAWMRATVDPNQGGAVVDLRPYVSRLHRPVGADTEILYDGSYPYILHAQYRGGWPCFMDTKSMFTGAITCRGRTVLLNHQRTQCDFRKEGGDYLAIMNPVELDFGDLTAACMTKVVFRGAGAIEMQRTIACAVPDCEFEVLDFLNGTCGTTEYPTDMRNVILGYIGAQGDNQLKFAYTGRSVEVPEVDQVYACVPDAGTRIVLSPGRKPAAGLVRDGIVTGPMYTLGIRNKVKAGEVSRTCLTISAM